MAAGQQRPVHSSARPARPGRSRRAGRRSHGEGEGEGGGALPAENVGAYFLVEGKLFS
jgi:hypothetical protein